MKTKDDDFDKDRYCTPGYVMADVRRFFAPDGIELDMCGDPESVVDAEREYDIRKGQDALVLPLDAKTLWFQPPYSGPSLFIDRVVKHVQLVKVETAVGLIPGTPATKWWARYITPHARAICFWGPERIAFLKNGVPDPSPRQESAMVLVCSPDVAVQRCKRFQDTFATRGLVATRPTLSAWEWHSETPLEEMVRRSQDEST